jgi:signal peptide peptidase SppA
MGSRRYTRVLKFFAEHPWALLPARLESMIELLELRAAGQAFTDEEIQQRIGAGPRVTQVSGGTSAEQFGKVFRAGPVAVLPLYGVISPRMNMMTQVSGGTSTEQFGKVFRAAMADPEIAAIAIDVDSPGGSVFGMEELASIIRSGRGRKPIAAVANTMMASAAYWLASQADQVVASPSSQVGSIGVIGVHQDISQAEAKDGITTTLVTAGKFKGDGNEHQPLSDTARATMQQMVDSYYAAFTRDVSRGRAVSQQQVRDGMGEGRILNAQEALRAGLVDGIGTLEQTLGRLAAGKPAALKAEADAPAFEAPLPNPHKNEDKKSFVDRCMGDDVMNKDYPDVSQRRAVCESQWDRSEAGQAGATAEVDDFRRRLAAHT